MKKLIGILLLILFCNSADAQKYEFDYLLEWETVEGWRADGSTNTVLINSKNSDYYLTLYKDLKSNGEKAQIWDFENELNHFYEVSVSGSNEAVLNFAYAWSTKTGKSKKFSSVPMELKEIGQNNYVITTYANKNKKKPQYRFEFTLEESPDNLFFFHIEGINKQEMINLIKSGFPENKHFVIANYKTIYPSGSIEHMKLTGKQKVALTLEFSPEQLILTKK